MAETKNIRTKKKQLGQFMTPTVKSTEIVSKIEMNALSRVLEPSFGDGAFIIPIIDKLLEQNISLTKIMGEIIYGVELDIELYNKTLMKIKEKYGELPEHNLINGDYLIIDFKQKFTNIIGNPPFGGTINYEHQDRLEKLYGVRLGNKIKKETYSFFMVKSLELLTNDGCLSFICSDTMMSIKTMGGLRKYLFNCGSVTIETINEFSNETNYPMVLIRFVNSIHENFITVNNTKLGISTIKLTPNYSWSMDVKWSKYLQGSTLSEYITTSGGLTTGKNEYFIREILDGKILETHKFEYYQESITLDNELSKAKLNKLGKKKLVEIKKLVENNQTKENVRITEIKPTEIEIPNNDYCYYNKAINSRFYSKPKNVVYWKDDGKAVITYKKNSNWYLHGVGGKNFFKKEGITWQLISKRINARYLPEGYILDNSSPIGVLKENIDKDELFFILGWLLTDLATELQKKIINHTKNIQPKDVERLPYPFWVTEGDKVGIIKIVKDCVNSKQSDIVIDEEEIIGTLNSLYEFK
jgi:predicted RNA methylase